MDTGILKNKFTELYHGDPLVVRSPGRVNIIGEHTDYNEGFVLPAAINKAIYVAVNKRSDDAIELFSVDYNESHNSSVTGVEPSSKHWPNYILGVVDQLNKAGYFING